MNKFMIGLAGLVLAIGAAPQAHAQGRMMCAERDAVLQALHGRYGEQVHGMGLSPDNRIMEVFVSEETGSWTITVTSVDGTTCLMASGEHFETMIPAASGEDL